MAEVALYRRLLGQARPYWLHLAGAFGLGLLASPVALLTPLPLKLVVDSVLGTRPLPAFLGALLPAAVTRSSAAILLFAIGLLVVVAAIGQMQVVAGTLLRTWVGERLVLDFRARLVDQVQRLSLSYHDSKGTADSLYRIQHDALAIQNVMVEGAIPFASAAVTLATMVAVLLIGVGHVRAGVLTLGQLLLVMGYLGQLYEPLKAMSRKASSLQSSLASAERAFALLSERPDVPERANARPLLRAAGGLAFRHVSFAYGSGHPVLEDVSFDVPPGTRAALV